MGSKLEWALYWARRGFRVFPLWGNSKKPVWDDYLNRATLDLAIITDTWTDKFTGLELDYNIGAVPHNQVLADFDVKRGDNGIAAAQQLGFDFHTLLARTPSGGLHGWYVGPPTANSAGRIAPGIDTRGPSGYAVMPGSVTAEGQYELIQDLPLAPVQQFVLDRLRAPRDRSEEQAALVDIDTPSAIALASNYLRDIPGAQAGVQNETTFRVAAHVRDLGVSEATASDLLSTIWSPRCSPPIPPDEIDQITANAYAYAQNAPGSKHPFADFAGYVPTELPPPALPAIGQPHQLDLFDSNPFATFGNMVELPDLLPRDWIMRRFLERKAVTTLLATGGIGKSQFLLTVAAHLALGSADIFGFENVYAGVPQYSVIYNAEDDENEMSARLHALCHLLSVDYHRVKPYISLVSGRRVRLKIMTKENGQVVMNAAAQNLLGMLISACLSRQCVLLGLDPLNKLHELNENDNVEMGRMMENLGRIAELANVALLLSHHLAKPAFASGDSVAGNAGAGRGAGEIVNGSRAAYTLSPPTSEDINRFGLTRDRQIRLLRLDNAKLNRALIQDGAAWLERAGATLTNGEEVGAFLPADPQDETEALRSAMARVLAAELTQNGKGSVTLAEAAECLMRGDQIYAQLAVATVKSRIERFLLTPIVTTEGNTVTSRLDGQKKVVTLT